MTTEATGKRLDAQVRGKVIVQRAWGLKPSVALVTGVWSFTSVRVNVVLEMGCPDRRIGAMWAGVQDHETDLQTWRRMTMAF